MLGLMTLPDLDELLGLRGLARGLAAGLRRPARALSSGGHHSAHRGRGLEFQEVRPYVAGDDPRTIDWRVTARRGRPHTKLYREERERPVWLAVDLNPALFFGTRRQLKSAAVVRAAAVLAWVCVLGGDRVGAAIHNGSELRVVAPRPREAGVLALLAALVDLQPRAPGHPRPESLDAAVGALVPLVRPGSLLAALSDFAGLGAAADASWAALGSHSAWRLLWICDPLEEQGLPSGRFRVGLPESVRILDGAGVRSRWLDAWRTRKQRVESLAGRLGAPLTRLDTHVPVEDALVQELAGRRALA
jgi:uncharacterized protein (DUF58 family)